VAPSRACVSASNGGRGWDVKERKGDGNGGVHGIASVDGTVGHGDSHAAEGRRGPTWREWVLSILVAVPSVRDGDAAARKDTKRSGRIAPASGAATVDLVPGAATARIRPAGK